MSFFTKYMLYYDQMIVKPTSNGNPLLWRDDLGIGYLKSNGYSYDEDYWKKYHGYDSNEIGDKLTDFRVEFVKKNVNNISQVCDVGIGSGRFVKTLGCRGYDINPWAEKWLRESGYFGDPYQEKFEALTFWDVLEHIDNHDYILEKTDKIFISIPIHGSINDCLASKHLRPDEHIWHFTDSGIKFFMRYYGYSLVDQSDGETKAGREAIMSYYFAR